MPAPNLQPGVTRVLLLRHGQSEWNALGRWQGTADSPLTTRGLEQAAATASVLAGTGVDFSAIWSSDLSRARDTATVIGDALHISARHVDTDLREAHAGEWEGLTRVEIGRRWPGYLDAQLRPPRFELFESVVARALSALTAIAHASGPNSSGPNSCGPVSVIAVTHSVLIRSLLRHVSGTDPTVPNLGGAWFAVGTGELALTEMFDPETHGVSVQPDTVDVLGEEPGAPRP